MALNLSNSISLEHLVLKGLTLSFGLNVNFGLRNLVSKTAKIALLSCGVRRILI